MTNPESPRPDPGPQADVDDEQLAISVRGLTNRFGSQTVHEDLDLDVRRGEILGPPVDLGARINRYRCCLPALAGFSI